MNIVLIQKSPVGLPVMGKRQRLPDVNKNEGGVVMIMALSILLSISILAVTSIRSSTSSERIAANVKTAEMASQAAEMALRYCEAKAIAMGTAGETPNGVSGAWMNGSAWNTAWDSNSTSNYILPDEVANPAGMAIKVYQRPPECMIEETTSLSAGDSLFYLITARGFSPDALPADSNRSRPAKRETWLQSSIEVR